MAPKLTQRQRDDRALFALLENQRIDLEIQFARDKSEIISKAYVQGYGHALDDFKTMSLWQRMTWTVKK